MRERKRRNVGKVHAWTIPKPGDDALVCTRCERTLNLIEELAHSHWHRERVLDTIRAHEGPDIANRFHHALLAAISDARRRQAG